MSSMNEVIDLTRDEDRNLTTTDSSVERRIYDLTSNRVLSLRKNRRRGDLSSSDTERLTDEARRLSVADSDQDRVNLRTPSVQRRESLPNGIECVVCYQFETAITSAQCGHVCCVNCMEKILKTTSSCPVCRKPTTRRQLRRIYLT